jgi:D-alanyl-lipoteichoic acid acyltransferase DltB (MBOAT superfamily)
MMPQFASLKNRVLNFKNLSLGLYLFFIGLFKKVLIADQLSPLANFGFDTAKALTLVDAWVTSLSYTLQLYFDFSAYTDMALGAALMFNIRLPFNFNSPYSALNITDFWRRWHMTLSRFLRDYIYIPLGGNRKGDGATSRNVLATFLIGGIWHGAGWTFVFWGFLHGTAAVIHRMWERSGVSMPRVLAWLLTFNFVNIAWVFFRANSWDDAFKVLSGMFGMKGVMLSPAAEHVQFLADAGVTFGPLLYRSVDKNAPYLISACFFVLAFAPNSNGMTLDFKPGWRTALFTLIVSTYALLHMSRISEFLYFNF